MATGKQSIIIDSDEFVKGVSTSSNLTDGGFSPESDAINPFISPGVIYPPNTITTLSSINVYNSSGSLTGTASSLDGNVIASCYDTLSRTSSSITDRFILTDNGSIYSLDISAATLSKIGTSINNAYTLVGICDMQVYGLDSSNVIIWISHANAVTGIFYNYSTHASGTTATLNPTNWDATSPHPLKIYNRLLFMADKNQLHTHDNSVSTSQLTSGVLTLQSDETITAVEVDPYTGRLLLGLSSRGYVGTLGDKTTTVFSPAYLGLYDGYNPTQLVRKIPVDDTITSFRICGGIVNAFYGNRIGVWNGQGIQFLRHLNFNGNVGGLTTNIYKHKSTNVDNMLFFVANGSYNNTQLSNSEQLIMGYGEIMPGTRAFFNLFNQSGSNPIDFISNVQNTQLVFSSNHNMYLLSLVSKNGVASTGDTSPIFMSKRYSLPKMCTITEIRVYYEDNVASNAGTIGNVSIIDEKRNADYSIDVTGNTMVASRRFDAFPSTATTEFQIKYQWKETSSSHGIQKIMVFYQPFE